MISMSLSKAASAINTKFYGKDIIFSGLSTDSRTIKKGNLFIALKGKKFDGHDYITTAEDNGAAALMLTETIPHKIPALKVTDTYKAMGQLAHFWRNQMTVKIVAITGSNGKTTVKEMVNKILSEVAVVHATAGNFNNNIGVPITLFGLNKKHQYAVIEMGANHLGEIEWLSNITNPNIAAITQCSPAHLEGFGSIDNIAIAKSEIYSGLQKNGTAIINADDNYADFWRKKSAQQTQLTFGIDAVNADVRAEKIDLLHASGVTQFELVTATGSIDIQLPLLGKHNVINALAAAACCLSLNISLQVIKNGLRKLSAIDGRLQLKQGKNESKIIDDTYNANPSSLYAALAVLAACHGNRYLVLGDMKELGNRAIAFHHDAGIAAKKTGIDGLFTIGELSAKASQSYGNNAMHFNSYEDLGQALLARLHKDTTILVKGSRGMQLEQIVAILTRGKD